MNSLFGKKKITEWLEKKRKPLEAEKARNRQNPLPFAHKDPSRLNVFIRTGTSTSRGANEVPVLLKALKEDYGDDKTSPIDTERLHYEIHASILTLPGFDVVLTPPRVHFSRTRNREADNWEQAAYKDADCFVFAIDIESADAYLSSKRRCWEAGRFEVSAILRRPAVVENHRKPLLLLISIKEDEDLDSERVANLLGLGSKSLGRPFHAVAYSHNTDKGVLKEAFEWLALTSHTASEESTAAPTECETEDEGSVSTFGSKSFPSPGVDGGSHYVLDYEPTLLGGNPTLQRFEPIKKGTPCPFARAAKLWGAKPADENRPRLAGRVNQIQEAAQLNVWPLAEFVARSNNGEPLDGFCMEVPGLCGSFKVEYVGEKVCELLTKLAELDPSGENAMRMGRIDDPLWRFRFAGEDFFLTTFSPVYKEDSSPRHVFGARRTFLLLQPMSSFARHGLSHDTPASATNWHKPTSMRDKARVAFKTKGCLYHIPEELPYPVAEHVVKPEVDDGVNVVRWWLPRKDKK